MINTQIYGYALFCRNESFRFVFGTFRLQCVARFVLRIIIAREFLTNNRDIDKYGIWAEEDGNDDHSFHIEASRHWKGGIDYWVYDAHKDEAVVNTLHDRLEKERQKYEEDMSKLEESMHSL